MIAFLATCSSSFFDNNCAQTRCSSFAPCFFNPSETSKKLLFSASLVVGTFLVYKIAVFANAYFSPPPPPAGASYRPSLPPSQPLVSEDALANLPDETPLSTAREAYLPITARMSAFSPVARRGGVLTARTDSSAFTLVDHSPLPPPPPPPPQTLVSRVFSFFSSYTNPRK